MTQSPAAGNGASRGLNGGPRRGEAAHGLAMRPWLASDFPATTGRDLRAPGAAGPASGDEDAGEEEGGLTEPATPQPADSWRGWLGRAAGALGILRPRLAGGEADQFGFDPDFNSRVLLPLARLFYQHWFRVQLRGLENVPAHGAALVVANHSGTLPMDAVMLQAGLHDEHPGHRNLRLLGADLVYQIPLLGPIASRGGHVRACPANAHILLRAGELVGVFPEGFKGVGKPFSERYQLRRFGHGGFAATAIRARAPIIPCAIVGAEEIYPLIGNAKPVADLLRLPYFPVTPLFPWLGPVGMVPLPSRWIIEFCPPVPTDCYQPGSERDPAVVNDLSGRVRGVIQRKLDDLVAERGSAF